MATICPHCGEDIEAIEEEAHHLRIFRGGCWARRHPAGSAFRLSDLEIMSDSDLGFRLVLPQ
jgi:hypothetical protein